MNDTLKHAAIVVTGDERLQTDAEAIETLLVGFGEGDLGKVRNALNMLGKASENQLHVRVTELTQEFHNRLNSVRQQLSSEQITMTTTNIPDAARKLEYVLEATSTATHKLFAMIENLEGYLDRIEKMSGELAVDMERLPIERRSARFQEYAKFKKVWLTEVRVILNAMVMGQEHQDLCGQALAKVQKLVKELESNLTAIIKRFGLDTSGPDVNPDDTKVGQDGVDDILKQLGF